MTRPLVLACCFGALLSATPVFADGLECAPAPSPVVSLNYVSRYTDDDASRATIDPLRVAEAEAAIAPVDAFILSLTEAVDAMYVAPVARRAEAAESILDQLLAWAEADALSDLGTETVGLTIGSRYAALALVHWQTLPYAFDHPARPRVLEWLDLRMDEQQTFWETAPEGARSGNLRAWAGLAAAGVAVQTSDAGRMVWAENAISEVICTAEADGSLPQEMTRGRLALQYQLHAIAPLVTAAALLEREGHAVSRACDGALHRIVEFALSDLFDGSKTAEITGKTQNFFDGSAELQKFQLAWIEPYLALRHNEDLALMADDLAPLSNSKLGGNQTALWGH